MNLFTKVFLFCLLCNACIGQKKTIDATAYLEWTKLERPYLTNDGKFFKYNITNVRLDKSYTVIKSVDGKWKQEFYGEDVVFMNNDHCFLFVSNDSIFLHWLGAGKSEVLKIVSFNVPDIQDKQVLLYQESKNPSALVIRDLKKNSKIEIPGVGVIKEYSYIPSINGIILKTCNSDQAVTLKYTDINNRSVSTITSGKRILCQFVDKQQEKLAFISQESNNRRSVWVYSFKNKTLATVKSYSDRIIASGYTKDGKNLIVTIEEEPSINPIGDTPVLLDLWSYKNLAPGENSHERILPEEWTLNLENGNLSPFDRTIEKFGMVANTVEADSISKGNLISPDNKFAIYIKDNNYYSYEYSSGIRRNLTGKVKNSWNRVENGDYDALMYKGRVQQWLSDEDGLLVADEYDIWKISLTNSYTPVNLTNGYGRKNKLQFHVVNNDDRINNNEISSKEKIIFAALDLQTKKNGFFSKKNVNAPGDPELLTMDNAAYWIPIPAISYYGVISSSDCKPQKAKNADVYLVAKETATSSRNFFLTKDFKHFTLLTDNYPEKSYNWLTTELVNWRTDQGIPLQGVLYKPANFDSLKKYPVIFYYYRKSSSNLNSFPIPKECPGCIIDIPSYVSNGYLVFTPDIYFKKGETGKSALAAVTSAARHLSARQYVNDKKIGIQGCSFSGFTTNYIVTHTDIFAAACSASGLFDMVSGYNSLNGGDIKQGQFEPGGPYQMGGTLWEAPQDYIENSAVFNADKLTTPFLVMHTTDDYTIPIWNAIEFFLASKRLNKKVWLLQYGGENSHTVKGKEGLDFMLRMRQFFDHYLKDTPPPKWMTSGRYSRSREIDEGLELDYYGAQP